MPHRSRGEPADLPREARSRRSVDGRQPSKAFRQRGEIPTLYHWRASGGPEVDLVVERNGHLDGLEVKATATPLPGHAESLARWRGLAGPDARGARLQCRGAGRPPARHPRGALASGVVIDRPGGRGGWVHASALVTTAALTAYGQPVRLANESSSAGRTAMELFSSQLELEAESPAPQTGQRYTFP